MTIFMQLKRLNTGGLYYNTIVNQTFSYVFVSDSKTSSSTYEHRLSYLGHGQLLCLVQFLVIHKHKIIYIKLQLY